MFLILLRYLSFLIAKKKKKIIIINKKLSSGVGLVMDLSLFLLGLSQSRFLRLVQEDSFSCFYVSFVLLCYLSFPVAKKRKKEKKSAKWGWSGNAFGSFPTWVFHVEVAEAYSRICLRCLICSWSFFVFLILVNICYYAEQRKKKK